MATGDIKSPFNMEVPLILPKRSVEAYADDPPITSMGEMCAQLLGNRLAESGIVIDLAFSSPSARCVVTCFRLLEGYQDFLGDCAIKIKIDGGLYEYGQLATGPINFEEPIFYNSRGIPCDLKYKNTISAEELTHNSWETYPEFVKRASEWILKVIKEAPDNTNTILFCSHAPTIITFAKLLLRKTMDEQTLNLVCNSVAYLGAVLMEQNSVNGKWSVVQPQPVQSFQIRAKTSFNQSWFNKTSYESSVFVKTSPSQAAKKSIRGSPITGDMSQGPSKSIMVPATSEDLIP